MSVNEWLEKYPEPASVATRTSREEVLKLIEENPKQVAILDLRGERAPGYIRDSVHIPAPTIEGYEQLKSAVLDPIAKQRPEAKLIVVHCNSSGRRASKVGGWLDDYNKEHGGVQATILHEGIVGWLGAGEPFESHLVRISE